MDAEEFAIVLGMILLFVFTVMRLFAGDTKAAWGNTFLYFSGLMGLFIGCFSGTVTEALGVAVPGALTVHAIAFLRTSGHQKNTGKSQPKPAQQKPVSKPKPAAPKPASNPKQAQQKPAAPKPATTQKPPVAQKSPEVRQTLTACIRCGRRLQMARCGYCGYDHAAGQLRLLCRVDPRKLQLKKSKRSGQGGTP